MTAGARPSGESCPTAGASTAAGATVAAGSTACRPSRRARPDPCLLLDDAVGPRGAERRALDRETERVAADAAPLRRQGQRDAGRAVAELARRLRERCLA